MLSTFVLQLFLHEVIVLEEQHLSSSNLRRTNEDENAPDNQEPSGKRTHRCRPLLGVTAEHQVAFLVKVKDRPRLKSGSLICLEVSGTIGK